MSVTSAVSAAVYEINVVQKVLRVIKSCKTNEQLCVACRYIQLATSNVVNYLAVIKHAYIKQWEVINDVCRETP